MRIFFLVESFLLVALCLTAAAVATRGSSHNRPDASTVFIDAHSANIPWVFVPIGAENVTSLVLEDEQSAWVLFFHEGWLFEPFREAAEQLRGLLRFGLVHRDDLATAQLLKFDPSTGAKFRSLPCGPADHKLSDFLDTDVFDAAVNHASDSVPRDSIVSVKTEDSLKQLLTEAVTSVPSKFTAVFAIRDSTSTLLHRVLAAKLSSVYNFGLLVRAKPHEPLDRFGLPGYATPVPGLLILQLRAGAGPDGNSLATVEISRLDESGIVGAADRDDEDSEDADLKYADALRFLVEYNRNFRAELLGENRANETELRLLSGLLQRERLAFGVFDLGDRPATPDGADEADDEKSKDAQTEKQGSPGMSDGEL